jgi:hypothetical protein
VVNGPNSTAAELISAVDEHRMTLTPMQEAELTFRPTSSESKRTGYVLRMTGYYTFQMEVAGIVEQSAGKLRR